MHLYVGLVAIRSEPFAQTDRKCGIGEGFANSGCVRPEAWCAHPLPENRVSLVHGRRLPSGQCHGSIYLWLRGFVVTILFKTFSLRNV